ncbi:hypothetical protein B0H19DRAFT_1071989 [Mycena capillaripes]|nr:hypothetical protein B0H19DRAFT_1071989 [Mycena capillaripes]
MLGTALGCAARVLAALALCGSIESKGEEQEVNFWCGLIYLDETWEVRVYEAATRTRQDVLYTLRGAGAPSLPNHAHRNFCVLHLPPRCTRHPRVLVSPEFINPIRLSASRDPFHLSYIPSFIPILKSKAVWHHAATTVRFARLTDELSLACRTPSLLAYIDEQTIDVMMTTTYSCDQMRVGLELDIWQDDEDSRLDGNEASTRRDSEGQNDDDGPRDESGKEQASPEFAFPCLSPMTEPSYTFRTDLDLSLGRSGDDSAAFHSPWRWRSYVRSSRMRAIEGMG